jgi:hypothetical protein
MWLLAHWSTGCINGKPLPGDSAWWAKTWESRPSAQFPASGLKRGIGRIPVLGPPKCGKTMMLVRLLSDPHAQLSDEAPWRPSKRASSSGQHIDIRARVLQQQYLFKLQNMPGTSPAFRSLSQYDFEDSTSDGPADLDKLPAHQSFLSEYSNLPGKDRECREP